MTTTGNVETEAVETVVAAATWARNVRTSDYVVFWLSGDYYSVALVTSGSEWEAVEALRTQYASAVHKVLEAIEVFRHSKPLIGSRLVRGNADLRALSDADALLNLFNANVRLHAVNPGDKDWHEVKAFNNRVVRAAFGCAKTCQ